VDSVWAFILGGLVVLVALFAGYEYRGLTDRRPGGTVSEWTHENVPHGLVWAVLPITLLGAGLALAWHFTVGQGRRWWPQDRGND
jgi:hypothetical protein